MISYQSRNQIQDHLLNLIPHQIEECKKCDELPASLAEFIKHNYQAKFVCYDKASGCIEVGVEKQEFTNSYPEIKVHRIPLEKAVSQLKKTFRNSDLDLKFYGRLLAGQGSTTRIEDVVLV